MGDTEGEEVFLGRYAPSLMERHMGVEQSFGAISAPESPGEMQFSILAQR